MVQVRGAHSSVLVDGVVLTSDQSACPRVALLRSRDVQQTHDAATLARFELGHKNEEYFVDTFMKGVDFKQDVEVVKGFFTGHADIISDGVVYELKSVTSKNVQKKVFDKGQYKLSNLFQLVGYMYAAGLKEGKLVYSFWQESEEGSEYSKTHKPGETRFFSVALTDTGHVVVDGVRIEYTLKQWYDHHKLLVETLNRSGDRTMPYVDFPVNPQDSWNEPCKWCPFHSVCQTFNARTGTIDEFVELCKEVVK